MDDLRIQSLTPEWQSPGHSSLRVSLSMTPSLPPITVAVGSGSGSTYTFLDAREARALAAMLIAAADEVPCEECHGNGAVTINRSVRADPQEAEDVECPSCEGSGASKALAQVAEQIG